jgi:hypothetical protein
MANKFLTGDHTPYEAGTSFEGISPVTDLQTSEVHNSVRRRKLNSDQFGE